MVSGCSGSIAWLAFATSTTSTRSPPSCSRSAWPFAGTASGSSSPWMTSTGADPGVPPLFLADQVARPPLHRLRLRVPALEPDRSVVAGRKERVLDVGETLLVRPLKLEDAFEGFAGLRRRGRLPPGGDQRHTAHQLRPVGGKATHNTVAEGVAHEVSRPARQVLDDSRRIIREIVQRQSRHGGGTVAGAAGAYAGGPVAGGREVVHQRIEVVGAAPQGGDEDHQLPAAPHLYLDLATLHCYSQRVLPGSRSLLGEPAAPRATGHAASGYRPAGRGRLTSGTYVL